MNSMVVREIVNMVHKHLIFNLILRVSRGSGNVYKNWKVIAKIHSTPALYHFPGYETDTHFQI